MRKTKCWAVIAKHGAVHVTTVRWKRSQAIEAYTNLWEPLGHVPDWHERSILWRWRWLKRLHNCTAERVVITPEADIKEGM